MTKLFCLGQHLIHKAYIADCPHTKQLLSKVLKTSRPTIWRYEGIAYYCIPEFKDDYPELPKELWIERGSSRDRTVPLSPFQSWCISLISTAYKCLRKKDAVEQFIKTNPYLFTKNKYLFELEQLAKQQATANIT